jgi:heme/copper-type cytochrome/quinol oxidase subunit 2
VKKVFKSYELLLKTILILVSLLSFGYYRDFLFKTINGLLKAWDFDVDYVIPPSLKFLENYQYDTLLNLKWVLTLVFSIVYLMIALFAIKTLFNNRKYTQIAIGTYLGIILFSSIFILIGYLFHSTSEKMYEFARYFMGLAQSPIILMILIPAFKISEKEINPSNYKDSKSN